MTLNPHFPGWFWLTPLFHAFHRGDDRAAVACARRVNMPGYFWVPFTMAAALGHLGESDAAARELQELLTVRPDRPVSTRDELAKWFQPDLMERFLDGLRKAGLDLAR
jgi:adenylate cyclase